jgi:nitrite reductase/ring-hydroxylating ferredoxin subunit
MGFFKRLFGICRTQPPTDPGCWELAEGGVAVDLGRASELERKGGAIRLEGGGLGRRLLVFRGEDDAFHAFENRCDHGGRRLDPLPGAERIECCSMGKSTYDYSGNRISGAAKGPVKVLEVERTGDKLLIKVA